MLFIWSKLRLVGFVPHFDQLVVFVFGAGRAAAGAASDHQETVIRAAIFGNREIVGRTPFDRVLVICPAVKTRVAAAAKLDADVHYCSPPDLSRLIRERAKSSRSSLTESVQHHVAELGNLVQQGRADHVVHGIVRGVAAPAAAGKLDVRRAVLTGAEQAPPM